MSTNGGEVVVDATTGEDVFDPSGGRMMMVSLSPDGRYAVVTGRKTAIDDIETGRQAPLEDTLAASVGWTKDGRAFRIDDGTLTVCSPESGQCDSRRAELGDDGGGDDGDGGDDDSIILGGTILAS